MIFSVFVSSYTPFTHYGVFGLVPERTNYLFSFGNVERILGFVGNRKVVERVLATNRRIVECEYKLDMNDRKYLLDFFELRRGNTKLFWLPVLLAEFKVKTTLPAGATTLMCYDNKFVMNYKGYEAIAYQSCNVLHIRKITAVESGEDYEAIGIDEPFDFDIKENTNLYKVIPVRFLEDSLEIEYIKTNPQNYIAETRLRFVESGDEL